MSNLLPTTFDQIQREFEIQGYVVSRESTTEIVVPEQIKVPSIYFGQLEASPLIIEGRLIFQDEASMYAVKLLVNSLVSTYPKYEIIDARSECGNRSSYLSQLTKSTENVEIVPNAFITSQSRERPPFGAQISYLKAFTFPNFKYIVCAARLTSEVDNQLVVNEVLEGNKIYWESQDTLEGETRSLIIPPSDEYVNTDFVAQSLKKNIPAREEEVEELASAAEQDIEEVVEAVGGPKRNSFEKTKMDLAKVYSSLANNL
jgi:hypothetical protein